MKVLKQVVKELIISSRGFYFYAELIITFIILFIMLFIVPDELESKKEEYLFYNIKSKYAQMIFNVSINKGIMEKAVDKTFTLEPATIKLYPDRDGKPNDYNEIVLPLYEELEILDTRKNEDGSYTFKFEDKKEVTGEGYVIYDGKGGKIDKHVYMFNSFEDVLRLSWQEKNIGGVVYYDKNSREHYEIIFPTPVTQKYNAITYALHNDNIYDVIDESGNKRLRYLGGLDTLSFKQSFIPLIIVYLNGLISIFIVAGHIFNDKVQDVLRPTMLSPLSMREMLLAKLISSLPAGIITSLIIAIPIMKLDANYPLLILLVLATCIFAGGLGLLISAFFDNMKSSFGLMIIILVLLMLPILSYYVPTFSPSWIKLIPSHHMLLSIKDAITNNGNYTYSLITSAGLIITSIVLLEIASIRYKKGGKTA